MENASAYGGGVIEVGENGEHVEKTEANDETVEDDIVVSWDDVVVTSEDIGGKLEHTLTVWGKEVKTIRAKTLRRVCTKLGLSGGDKGKDGNAQRIVESYLNGKRYNCDGTASAGTRKDTGCSLRLTNTVMRDEFIQRLMALYGPRTRQQLDEGNGVHEDKFWGDVRDVFVSED
eukprot:GHVU01040076.1.p2 GENE.GHVU01040076.1~~GHVU01040076.1.p2  ORF type:complete len:174 (-),score=26.27 GHVU01040076.1:94-615(-)